MIPSRKHPILRESLKEESYNGIKAWKKLLKIFWRSWRTKHQGVCVLIRRSAPCDHYLWYAAILSYARMPGSVRKSVLSYYMGMFLTKLISEKLFHVSYLIHLGITQMKYIIQFDGKERRDMWLYIKNICKLLPICYNGHI